jgi:2-polyprenyl-3-methyl-5-hydroxy-6-metoxy-1,4-benzoquinol methylase
MGPFVPLDPLVPASGRILDWGAGHGVGSISMATARSGRRVTAVDIAPQRLEVVERAARRAGIADRVTVRSVEPEAVPEGRWTGIVIDDVLYLLQRPLQERLVRAAASAIEPGGALVCKEMATAPRWKRALAQAQEGLAVDRLGITDSLAGANRYPDPAEVGAWMADEGLHVEEIRLDRWRHVPHLAVVGRRPRGVEPADGQGGGNFVVRRPGGRLPP